MALPMPPPGQVSRVGKGTISLVLEHHKGALCLRSQENGSPRRHILGVPKDGRLLLEARPPEHRIRVTLEDRLTLARQGRLRGYIAVPLPHRLVWELPDGQRDPLLEVMPKELQTAWLGEGTDGGYVHETTSAFHLDRQDVEAEISAMVPVFLCNQSSILLTPTQITVSLRDRDLMQLGGQIVASPRRLLFQGPEEVKEDIRPIPRRNS